MIPVPQSLRRIADEIDGWLDLQCPERALEGIDGLAQGELRWLVPTTRWLPSMVTVARFVDVSTRPAISALILSTPCGSAYSVLNNWIMAWLWGAV